MSNSSRSPDTQHAFHFEDEPLHTPPTSGGDFPAGSVPTNMKELGLTPLARQLALTDEQTYGHWCSRCHGIWYGYTLETQCPVCGNRRG